jgi:aminoglycoside phosphotransferase (APT) family kinase protein
VRQTGEDRVLYYRQLRQTIRTVFLPELSSAQAIDAAALVDRILAEFIVEEAEAPALSREFGDAFAELLPFAVEGGFEDIRREVATVVAHSAASADPAERRRVRGLVDVERLLLEQIETRRAETLADDLDAAARPSGDGCSVTREQLTNYLRRRLPGSPDLVVDRLSVVPGGRSKETMLVSLRGTHELPPAIIVRKDRPVGLLKTRAADEFGIIRAVHDFGGVPVPEPFFAESGDVGLGEGTFLVMECVSGHKAGEFFPDLAAPTEHRAEIGHQLAIALARLHQLPLDRLQGLGLDTSARVTTEAIIAAVEGIGARIDELTGPPCATAHLARAWLREHVSDVVSTTRVCLLQGDFGFHNTLVDGAQVTALVDWEAAAIGPPARELAAAWSAATTLMPWPQFVAAYVDAGGPAEATDAGAISYYRVLSALGAFMTSRMGGHLFRTGAKRDLLTAHSGLDSHFRSTRNLARALADAMANLECT